jgi:DUF4097 and DUF4098 domain-containing protein YvlB
VTVQVNLAGARLVLTSSSRTDVAADGRVTVTDTPDGIVVSERLPADELEPMCRLDVPAGTTVDARIESGDLRVFNFQGTLRARLGTGSARIDHVDGRFRVLTDRGSVVFEHVRGGIDVLTNSATVSAREIEGEVQAVSQSGNLEFETIKGPIVARSTTGSIEATDLTGMARLSTRTGAVNVSSAYRQLTIRTQTGDVSLNGSIVDHTTVETVRGRVEVRLGPATDARIEAAARQGVVRSERIALAPGSGRRRVRSLVGNGRARLKLETGMGVVEIAGPTRASTDSVL